MTSKIYKLTKKVDVKEGTSVFTLEKDCMLRIDEQKKEAAMLKHVTAKAHFDAIPTRTEHDMEIPMPYNVVKQSIEKAGEFVKEIN